MFPMDEEREVQKAESINPKLAVFSSQSNQYAI